MKGWLCTPTWLAVCALCAGLCAAPLACDSDSVPDPTLVWQNFPPGFDAGAFDAGVSDGLDTAAPDGDAVLADLPEPDDGPAPDDGVPDVPAPDQPGPDTPGGDTPVDVPADIGPVACQSELDCLGIPTPACRQPLCDRATSQCAFVVSPDGAACDDGNACSVGDRCANGECVGPFALPCDDGEACTVDWCHAERGCQHSDNSGPCDDGDPCTGSDVCFRGECLGQVDPRCDCVDDTPCADFDDGDPCNGRLTCIDGRCQVDPATVIECATPPEPCVEAACDPQSGECFLVASSDGLACDDGDSCTLGDVCAGGRCAGQTRDCFDGDPCTLDTCEPGAGCVFRADDPARLCDDGNPCTVDGCVRGEGCLHAPIAENTPCDDGDFCTADDVCRDARCTGMARTCDDNIACTLDACDAQLGCLHTPQTALCPDAGPCAVAECTLAEGCVYTPTSAPCDDSDPCTTGDACGDGVCAGAPIDCDDGNVCTDDLCDDGQCRRVFNEADCDDGNPCTTGDRCQGGQCAPGTNTCCEPQCGERQCGDDGCGGSCGTCGENESCVAGFCVPGQGADTCLDILQCARQCAVDDEPCLDACTAGQPTGAVNRYEDLAACAQENGCSLIDETCLGMFCTAELVACVTGQ